MGLGITVVFIIYSVFSALFSPSAAVHTVTVNLHLLSLATLSWIIQISKVGVGFHDPRCCLRVTVKSSDASKYIPEGTLGRRDILVGCICDTLKERQSNADADWHDPRCSKTKQSAMFRKRVLGQEKSLQSVLAILKAIYEQHAVDQPMQQPRSPIRQRYSAEGLSPRSGAPSLQKATELSPTLERNRIRQSLSIVVCSIANLLPL
jgi:hypothetical protein